jgi:hypothetical protein
MTGVSSAQARRICELEATQAKEPPREPRTHTFFRDYHQTDADIRAEIDAGKRSGRIREGDRCLIFRWRLPDEAWPPTEP